MPQGNMYTVHIEGLKLPVRLGCYAEERDRFQDVEIDLALHIASKADLTAERLEDTIDYVAVVKAVSVLAREREWKLVERLSKDIAADLFAAFASLSSIDIRVRKFVLYECKSVGAAFHLKREEWA